MERKKIARIIIKGVVSAIAIAFIYIALLNGRYHFIRDTNFGCEVFDKWRCKVIDVEYIMDE